MIGGKITGHYRFQKGFYGLADMPMIFQEKIDRVLDLQTPAWQDDILIVTRGEAEEHFSDVDKILKLLENAGYRACEEKPRCLKRKLIGSVTI